MTAQAREAVARGQAIFNTQTININTGVAGINDAINAPTFAGSCGTCRDTPPIGGNHSVKAPLNIGIAGAGADAPPVLNTSALPVHRGMLRGDHVPSGQHALPGDRSGARHPVGQMR